jgi:hypothetical protein
MANKTISRVVLEGIVIGIIFIILFRIIKSLLINNDNYTHLFITAFLFHILGEIFGLNIWYVKDYINLLNN